MMFDKDLKETLNARNPTAEELYESFRQEIETQEKALMKEIDDELKSLQKRDNIEASVGVITILIIVTGGVLFLTKLILGI